MTFSVNPFQLYVCFQGTYIQELKIRSTLDPEIFFSLLSFQKKESSHEARKPLVYVDRLGAGLNPGAQQADAEAGIFKTHTL